jgi:hypothetical protein
VLGGLGECPHPASARINTIGHARKDFLKTASSLLDAHGGIGRSRGSEQGMVWTSISPVPEPSSIFQASDSATRSRTQAWRPGLRIE